MVTGSGWLCSIAGEWQAYEDRGKYYPACRGRKHTTGWARPRWNVRFIRSSMYWCNDCLPRKYRAAADTVALGQRRAIRIEKDGSIAVPPKEGK